MNKRNILILDDDPGVLWTLEEMLKGYGRIFKATTAVEAMEFITSKKFNLVLTDYLLEGHDSFDFINSLRVLDPECPIVMISSVATPTWALLKGVAETGIVRVIPKPFTKKELLTSVDDIFLEVAVRKEKKLTESKDLLLGAIGAFYKKMRTLKD